MTHDELIDKFHPVRWISTTIHEPGTERVMRFLQILHAVMKIHKPVTLPDGRVVCDSCVVTISTKVNPLQMFEHTAFTDYPCKTIKTIQEESESSQRLDWREL